MSNLNHSKQITWGCRSVTVYLSSQVVNVTMTNSKKRILMTVSDMYLQLPSAFVSCEITFVAFEYRNKIDCEIIKFHWWVDRIWKIVIYKQFYTVGRIPALISITFSVLSVFLNLNVWFKCCLRCHGIHGWPYGMWAGLRSTRTQSNTIACIPCPFPISAAATKVKG